MILTKESDYALRILRALSDGSQKSVVQIAKEQLIPQPFAYKIAKKLQNAGMISVSRGAEGGCRLNTDLGRFSLYDLIEATEEAAQISACMRHGYQCDWRSRNQACRIHERLAVIQKKLDEELKQLRLDELISGCT